MDKLDPALGAAIFLLLEQQGVHPDWEGWPSSEAEVLALTGANQDEAREAYDRLCEVLPILMEEIENAPPAVRVRYAVAGFVDSYPDAVRDVDGKRVYSDDFRDFIAGIRDPGDMGDIVSPEEVALAAGVPLDLYEEWVRRRR